MLIWAALGTAVLLMAGLVVCVRRRPAAPALRVDRPSPMRAALERRINEGGL